MNKTAIQKLTKAYGKYIGRKPWIEAPVLGAAGALAGYLGADVAVPWAVNAMMAGKSEQEKEDILRELEADNTMDLIRKLMTGMGAAGGAGYSLQKHLDVGGGLEGLGKSFVQGQDYWEQPEIQDRLRKNKEERLRELKYEPTRAYSSGRTSRNFQKAGSDYSFGFPENFEYDRVPLSESLDLINEDPFLTLPQKQITDIVLEGAENKRTGLVSGKDLMNSAVRLGVGASTGYIFGRAASSLLALPSPVKKRLSRVGALAGGIINTGIFSEIGDD